MILHGARLILPDRIQARGDLRVEDGKITALSEAPLQPAHGEARVDLHGQFLAPGFIDLHIHGALHRDTMEASNDAFETICRFHASGGTTALALTTTSAPAGDILKVIEAAEAFRSQPPRGARVLGVHVEGPYFSREKPGAHDPAQLRTPDRAEWGRWLEHADAITQVTLAPELPGALELIEALEAAGIRASAGHSDAWDEEAAAAFAHGLRRVTHVFNCMSGARRRGPYRAAGLLEFALGEPEIVCELIADGHHVSPTLMRMLYHAKGPEGICLITDAAAGAGLAEGETFTLAGMPCVVRGGVGMTADGSALAGSCATMIEVVRTLVRQVGVSLVEAVRMATLTPARALGLEREMGTLAVGANADLVALSADLQVTRTWVAGC